jgi:hypothetical protein
MPINTTNLNVTTTPVAIFSTATTWANNKNCGLYDPISFALSNAGVTVVRVGGSAITSATGFPISSAGGTFTWDVKAPGEVLFAVTSASTSNVDLMADRQ